MPYAEDPVQETLLTWNDASSIPGTEGIAYRSSAYVSSAGTASKATINAGTEI